MEHCVKSVPIQSYSGPHFPAFVLYGEIRSIQSELFGLYSNYTEYSVRMRENADQNNSEYDHFSRSVVFLSFFHENVNVGSLSIKFINFFHEFTTLVIYHYYFFMNLQKL